MTGNDQLRSSSTRGAEKRAEILRAATAMIAERGFRGTSLNAVAERAEISQQGLLHHFPTRNALLLAVLAARDEWDTGAVFEHSGDTWPLETWAVLVDYNATRPGMVRTFSALLGESVTGDHPAGEFFPRRYATVREKAASTLRAEFGDRLPNGHTSEELAPLLIAVLDGMQFQWLLDPGQRRYLTCSPPWTVGIPTRLCRVRSGVPSRVCAASCFRPRIGGRANSPGVGSYVASTGVSPLHA